MYDYDYYGYYDESFFEALGAIAIVMFIFFIALAAFMIICTWKIFKKSGEPGWTALFPGVNIYNMLKISFAAQRPWFLLVLVPFVNVVIYIMSYIKLAERFGHGVGFGIGIIFLPFIFLPILAFGKSQYIKANETA